MGILTEQELFPPSNQPSSEDFLGKLHEVIKEAKEGLQLLQQMGGGGNLRQVATGFGQLSGQKKTAKNVLDILNELGLADVPISAILQKVGPLSINQIAQEGRQYLEAKSQK